MTFSELLRLLRANGWSLERQGAGSAQIWQHPERGTITVHVHPSREVAKGTAKAILKQAGIKRR